MVDKVLCEKILKTILSCWAISIPLRTAVAYVRGEVYIPIPQDLIIDWIPLLIFGVWMFAGGIRDCYKTFKVADTPRLKPRSP